MPITKRPCSNCPFRCDDDAIELRPGRLEGIIAGLLRNDMSTFVCHKTLDTQRMTCAGAVAVMAKPSGTVSPSMFFTSAAWAIFSPTR